MSLESKGARLSPQANAAREVDLCRHLEDLDIEMDYLTGLETNRIETAAFEYKRREIVGQLYNDHPVHINKFREPAERDVALRGDLISHLKWWQEGRRLSYRDNFEFEEDQEEMEERVSEIAGQLDIAFPRKYVIIK